MNKYQIGKELVKLKRRVKIWNRVWKYLEPIRDYTKEELKEEYKKAYFELKENKEI